MDNTIFAKRLKQSRTAAKLTQSDLCKKAGVTAATISAYESANGTKGKNPSLDNALKLAKALNVSLDWLCGNDCKHNDVDYLRLFIETSIYLKTDNLIYLKYKRTKSSLKTSAIDKDGEGHKVCNIPLQDNDLTYNITSDIYRIREIMMTGAATDEMICVLIDNLYQKYKKENLNNLFCFEIIKDGETNGNNPQT